MNGYVALGSNLGNREENLRSGLERFAGEGLELLALSSVWETEPVDCQDDLWFLNMVAGIRTSNPPLVVLEAILEIEREVGRVRSGRNEPRVLDLDLLLLGELSVRGERLMLPHPRMWVRRFVLAPLGELEPGLRNPATGRTVMEELERAPQAVIRTVGRLSGVRPAPYNS